MKSFTIRQLPLLIIVIASVSCSSSTSYEEAMNENRNRIDDPARIGDAEFLVEIKSLNLFQVELLNLAGEKGYSSEVVSLGRDNVGPFQTFDSDLNELARKERFRLPTEMSEDHQARLHSLKQASREETDRNVIDELSKINQTVVQRFTSNATEAYDPDVRAFAARKIGSLRAHHDQIKKVEEGLLTTVKGQ